MIVKFDGAGSAFLNFALNASFAFLLAAFLLVLIRLLRGPTLPDRVVCLDLLVLIGINYIAAFTIATRRFVYLDIAIALGLVSFLATVAFARYIESRKPAQTEFEAETDNQGDD